MNLLRVRNSNSLQIGLAVGDIDNIQKNAVMDRYRVQVQTVLVLFLFLIKWQTQIRDLLNRSKDEEISLETKADLSSAVEIKPFEWLCSTTEEKEVLNLVMEDIKKSRASGIESNYDVLPLILRVISLKDRNPGGIVTLYFLENYLTMI